MVNYQNLLKMYEVLSATRFWSMRQQVKNQFQKIEKLQSEHPKLCAFRGFLKVIFLHLQHIYLFRIQTHDFQDLEQNCWNN